MIIMIILYLTQLYNKKTSLVMVDKRGFFDVFERMNGAKKGLKKRYHQTKGHLLLSSIRIINRFWFLWHGYPPATI